jgi:hypothetical protein
MASLTGQSISSSYDSLLKLTDNGPITSAFKEITDGLGGSTKLFVKNNGSFGFGAEPIDVGGDINVGITGTSWPAFSVLNTTTGDYISLETASTFSIISANNTGATNYNPLSFYVGGSERTKIGTTGQLTLNNYTSTSSFTGTVAGYLAFTSAGAIITTAAPGGISTLNTLTAATQTFAVGTAGTDFAISSATSTHTFNLPTASASNRGALSSTDWTTFNNKANSVNTFHRRVASYTLVLSDASKIIEMSVASANNLTVPLNSSAAFPVGTEIQVLQYGAGQTTIVATGGVTLRSKSGQLKIGNQYTGVTLVKVGTDEWYVIGNVAA